MRGLLASDATEIVEALSAKRGKTMKPSERQSHPAVDAERGAIDKGMKLGYNHPIGPLALADLVGMMCFLR
jgi:3-hydroxyacyl-CoA dehydrogenase, C-terminal domain